MTVAVRMAVAGLLRSPLRTLVRLAVLAAATALLGSMLLFVASSVRTMTATAVRSVPLDWQGPVSSHAAAVRVASEVTHQPGIAQAAATATAPLLSAAHSGPAGLTQTGSGGVLAVPLDYLTHIPTFRMLQGNLAPGGVVLDQQMAATLQAHLGDTVTLTPRQGAAPVALRVTGVAIVSAPDVLFQPLNPQLGPAPAQPPANIAIVPLDTFASRYAPALRVITAASVGSSVVPGALDGVQWQVQAQLATSYFTGSPSNALTQANQTRNRVERTLPGQVQFVDNLADHLNTAAGDALYAETLYIMLAVPGALIALGLAYLAALGTADRDRRELALLRARGGSRRDVYAVAGIESGILGLLAGAAGTGIAIAATAALISGGVGLTPLRGVVTGLVCVALAIAGAGAARFGVSVRGLRASVVESRRSVQRDRPPLWQRLGLDWIALIISGLIYWLTARTGFSAVVNPDSNPTLSLSVYMFFAPALLWIGATLLLVRLRGRLLAWLVRRGAGRRPASWRGFLLASAARRSPAINRGLIVVALLLAFGVNLGLFTATYDQQAKIDAQLTLGADVTATAPPGAVAHSGLQTKIAGVPGVRATTPIDHSYAYVGPDLQDTYGINAATIKNATSLRDSYFIGGSAQQTLDRLRARPDGILVSKETIADYSLRLGDLLKLRVLDRVSGHFKVVPFHVAGIVQEFPAAPRDSFMVANLDYLTAADRGGGPNVIFAKTDGNPAGVARRVAAATARDGTIVKDIREQTARTVSAITTVDLSGISKIEQAFAIILAAAAIGLFVALSLVERRHEFATMAAVGAPLRRIGAFLWSEATLVLGFGLALAVGLGLLMSEMLIAMLQHVFDPPPDALAVPWGFLLGLGGAAVAAGVFAALLALLQLGRLELGAILRES